MPWSAGTRISVTLSPALPVATAKVSSLPVSSRIRMELVSAFIRPLAVFMVAASSSGRLSREFNRTLASTSARRARRSSSSSRFRAVVVVPAFPPALGSRLALFIPLACPGGRDLGRRQRAVRLHVLLQEIQIVVAATEDRVREQLLVERDRKSTRLNSS